MQRLISSLLLAVTLVACSSDKESRYRDTSYLEQPPNLPKDPTYRADTSYGDTSRIEKKMAGLGDNVYLTDTQPLQLRIKQPVEKAWYTVALALKNSDFKVTDFDRGKKVFYISYGESSDGLFGLFSSEPNQYLLAMKEYGKETVVIATLTVDNSGSESNDKDGYYEPNTNNADQVLRKLYDVLHDDLRAE